MTTHQLSRARARQIAVQAQWLHRDRPPGLLELVRQLTLLQVDLTPAVAPSADLVAWSRLGSSYSPAVLESALGDQALVEYRGMIRPAEDLALDRADMADWDKRGEAGGWRKEARGEVAVVGRHASRDGSGTWPNESSRTTMWSPPRRRCASGRSGRLRSLGIARARGSESPIEPQDVGEVGEPAVIEGVRGTWRVDPDQLQVDPKLDATSDRPAGVLRVNAIHRTRRSPGP